jgi:hypothetical protein
MNVPKFPSASPVWSRYSAHVRLAVCMLLLPLLVTGLVLVPDARSDFVATALIITCCLYIDANTVTQRSRVKPKRAR